MEILPKDFKTIFKEIKNDINNTRFEIMNNANKELLDLYLKMGKRIEDNKKYGNNFVKELSIELKIEFPNMNGFSERNLYRMKAFYNEYKKIENLPPAVAKLPWSHNYTLIEKVKDIEKRIWYGEKCYENGWSKDVLIHQIDSNLYLRQNKVKKLNNFDKKLSALNSELAKEMMKDPYIFELTNVNENIIEKDIENAMIEKTKNLLLEFGKGFSFLGNQYKITTRNEDYYLDLLFYHIYLRCYVVVELKTTKFKPEYIGQLNFYVTAVNKTLKTENDNETIGLLLCKEKDKLSVEWSLESINNPIGVSSYEINKYISKDIINRLPTEEEINRHINLEQKKD